MHEGFRRYMLDPPVVRVGVILGYNYIDTLVTNDAAEADVWIRENLYETREDGLVYPVTDMVGLDVEYWRGGGRQHAATVQLCVVTEFEVDGQRQFKSLAIVIHTARMTDMPPNLARVIADHRILKLLHDKRNDLNAIREMINVDARACIEIKPLVNLYLIKAGKVANSLPSLKKMTEYFLGAHIKGPHCGDWDRGILDDQQAKYCVWDAWATIETFRRAAAELLALYPTHEDGVNEYTRFVLAQTESDGR